MDFNITGLLFFNDFSWSVIHHVEKIKLKKWQDYTLSTIMLALTGRLVYLAFLS
jgi:hypothetical protein